MVVSPFSVPLFFFFFACKKKNSWVYDKGDVCDKKETKDDLTEVAANISASKDIESEAKCNIVLV